MLFSRRVTQFSIGDVSDATAQQAAVFLSSQDSRSRSANSLNRCQNLLTFIKSLRLIMHKLFVLFTFLLSISNSVAEIDDLGLLHPSLPFDENNRFIESPTSRQVFIAYPPSPPNYNGTPNRGIYDSTIFSLSSRTTYNGYTGHWVSFAYAGTFYGAKGDWILLESVYDQYINPTTGIHYPLPTAILYYRAYYVLFEDDYVYIVSKTLDVVDKSWRLFYYNHLYPSTHSVYSGVR